MCLVCNVQLTEVTIVFPSNKRGGPDKSVEEPVDALCVWSTRPIRHAASDLFLQGMQHGNIIQVR